MTIERTLQRIPLARLVLAPENARFDVPVEHLGDLDGLAASIVAYGDLNDPLAAYPVGDNFAVWDGGRRLRALQQLNKGKKSKLPATLKDGVPVLVDADATAAKAAAKLRSAVSFTREKMHPADEFLHYKSMLDDGKDSNEIAAACSVPAPRVRQLLRLCGLAPEVLDAFRKGRFGLDVAQAFSITENHEKQRAALALTKKNTSAWEVKRWLSEGAMQANDRLAKLVGREAYAEAGGTFLCDLFTSREDSEDWADGALVHKLAAEKIESVLDALKEEGWAEVIYRQDTYDFDRGHEKVTHQGAWSKEDKARCTVFVVLDYQGKLDIRRGYVKPTKGGGSASPAVQRAKEEPARYGFGHGGHFKLTHVATEATRVALVRNPAAAYDGLLTHLAWTTLRTPEASNAERTTASALLTERRAKFVAVEGTAELEADLKAWAERLPTRRVAFCEAVAALSADDKAALLALCFACTLRAAEARFDGYDHKPARWSHLGWMAKHAGADLSTAWTPDADFIKGGSKDALFTALDDMGQNSADFAKAKKSELVATVTRLAGEKGWTPQLLATLTAVEVEPEPATGEATPHQPDDLADDLDDGGDDEPEAGGDAYARQLAQVIGGDE